MVVLVFPNIKSTVPMGRGPETPVGIICTPKSHIHSYQEVGLISNPALPGVAQKRFSVVGVSKETA
jgi:hypothetical protein